MFLSIAPVMLLQSYSIILLNPNINLSDFKVWWCDLNLNHALKLEFIK